MSKTLVRRPGLASAVSFLLLICAGVFGAIYLISDPSATSAVRQRWSLAFGVALFGCSLVQATIQCSIPEKKKFAVVGFVLTLFLFAGLTYRILHGGVP